MVRCTHSKESQSNLLAYEVAQLVKCLLGKHENLGVRLYACSLTSALRMLEMRGPWGLLAIHQSQVSDLCLSKEVMWTHTCM